MKKGVRCVCVGGGGGEGHSSCPHGLSLTDMVTITSSKDEYATCFDFFVTFFFLYFCFYPLPSFCKSFFLSFCLSVCLAFFLFLLSPYFLFLPVSSLLYSFFLYCKFAAEDGETNAEITDDSAVQLLELTEHGPCSLQPKPLSQHSGLQHSAAGIYCTPPAGQSCS